MSDNIKKESADEDLDNVLKEDIAQEDNTPEESIEKENKVSKRKGKKNSRRKERIEKKEKELTEEEKEEKRKAQEKREKNKPKDAKGSAKRLISYLTAKKFWLILVAVLVIISTAVMALSSLIMQPVYQLIQDVLAGKAQQNAAMDEILKFTLLMALAYVIASVMSYGYQKIMLNISVGILTQMRKELFDHLQTLPLSYFDNHKTGAIMSHFTNDIGKVSDLVQTTFVTIVSSSIQAIITITIMIIYSWRITLTITVAIALMMTVVLVITKICQPLFRAQQKNLAACNAYVEEYVRGIKVVQVFSYEETAKKEYGELADEYKRVGIKASIIGGLMSPLMSMITRINYAAAVAIGAHQIINGIGGMSVPKLVTYLSYVGTYGSPVASIAASYSTLISALAGAERVFAVLDIPPESDEGKVKLVRKVNEIMGWEDADEEKNGEGELAWAVPNDDGDVEYVPVKCDIDIKNVNFSYVEDVPVLKNVSTHVSSGEKLAFVGSTGAGKTTITNLINRFYEIDDGVITIDGIDIKQIGKASLRRSMAFVLQDSKLFAGTIADNIRYGRLSATDEEVREAAKLANADEFITKLKDGYDSEIRADGVNISLGQAQLINIARAAISKRPLLVLDEATSSVDTRTERLIEIGMDTLMEDKTVLVIAHRLSTVRNSEDILVLENGEVIEEGNHDQLIELAGKYYQLYTGAYELE